MPGCCLVATSAILVGSYMNIFEAGKKIGYAKLSAFESASRPRFNRDLSVQQHHFPVIVHIL